MKSAARKRPRPAESVPHIVIETAAVDDPETMDRVLRALIDVLDDELRRVGCAR